MTFTRKVTPAMEDRIGKMAARPCGVTAPEVADALNLTKWTARRAVLRLVQSKRLCRTDEKRRRTFIYERAGRGGNVFRATAEEKRRWVGSRNLRGRPRSRGRWW